MAASEEGFRHPDYLIETDRLERHLDDPADRHVAVALSDDSGDFNIDHFGNRDRSFLAVGSEIDRQAADAEIVANVGSEFGRTAAIRCASRLGPAPVCLCAFGSRRAMPPRS